VIVRPPGNRRAASLAREEIMTMNRTEIEELARDRGLTYGATLSPDVVILHRSWIGEPFAYVFRDGTVSARIDSAHRPVDVVPPSVLSLYLTVVSAMADITRGRVPDMQRSALLWGTIEMTAEYSRVVPMRILEETIAE
jgi:hypothetical protein